MPNAILDRHADIGNNDRPMDIPLAVICDAANVSLEGKMNILGNFATINASKFPTRHPQMNLVLRMEASPAEIGMKKHLEVVIIDPDGERVSGFTVEFEIPEAQVAGEPVGMQTVLSIRDTVFPRPGRYSIEVIVNQETKAHVPLTILQTGEGE